MSKNSTYYRPVVATLTSRLREPLRFIQVLIGARQVGKTTAANQAVELLQGIYHYATADVPSLRSLEWIVQQWEIARKLAEDSTDSSSVLILDEIQKIPEWSEVVKLLWDEDRLSNTQVKVVVLASTPLFMKRGLTESLAGRFEVLNLPHWSFSEMRDAFDFDLDEYLFFGGYPGAATLSKNFERWADYIQNSLVEPTIARDVLMLTRVDKPTLLRRLFELGCTCSGQILSYNKMLGQLQDAGNATTLAHYLDLLAKAGMLVGLPKYAGQVVRQRGSSPKLQVFNTALITAQYERPSEEALNDSEFKGRLIESAVGAHLVNAAAGRKVKVFYWRENNREVDFIVETGSTLTAIEVKSSRVKNSVPGISAFSKAFNPTRILLIGSGGISVSEFLSKPVEHWLF